MTSNSIMLCVLAVVGIAMATADQLVPKFRRQSTFSSASASASASSGTGSSGGGQGYQPPYQGYDQQYGYGQRNYGQGQGYYPDPAQLFQDFARYGGGAGAAAGASAGNQFPSYYQGYGMHNYGPNFDYFRYNQPAFNFPDFNRLANDLNARGGGGGGAAFHSHSSTNVNGIQSQTSSGAHIDPEGRVTMYRDGLPVSRSGGAGLQGRAGGAGMPNGVYSVSSTNVDQNGRVLTYKDAGHF